MKMMVAVIERADGKTERVHKATNVAFQPGDRVNFFTAGGGGYGDPRERDPDLLRRDVAMGLVTSKAAARDYGMPVENPAGAPALITAKV